jgi:hypothetical protein
MVRVRYLRAATACATRGHGVEIPMDKDRIKGSAEKIKGKLKEIAVMVLGSILLIILFLAQFRLLKW